MEEQTKEQVCNRNACKQCRETSEKLQVLWKQELAGNRRLSSECARWADKYHILLGEITKVIREGGHGHA